MMSSALIYTGFEIYSSEEGWTRPNIEPIIGRVEDEFSDKCVEVTLMAYRSRHFVAHLRLHLGKEYVVRVEFAFMAAVPWRAITAPWTLESEVATMIYLKENTSIPIPKIYMYDNDTDRIVGGPWMVMDYIPAPSLYDSWPSMSSAQRKTVYSSVADIWSQLFALRFQAIGSLTFAKGQITVGPVAPLPSSRLGDVSPPLRDKCGPFGDTVQWLRALAHSDLSYVNTRHPVTKQDLLNVSNTLSIIEKNCPCLTTRSNDMLLSSITLRPVDLCPYNILVSSGDPTKIVGVIDWEGTLTNPIWNVSPIFFSPALIYDNDALARETEDLEIYLWDEVARRSPLWAEGRDRGKPLRDLARRALWSSADPKAMELPDDIDLRTSW